MFQAVAEALLERRSISIRYTDYGCCSSLWIVSPQTLVLYRDNWYLDALCHRRQALRTFALSRIDSVDPDDGRIESMPRQALETQFTRSYGIFAGEPIDTVTLRFLPEIAREIAMQQWHPRQHGRWEGKEFLIWDRLPVHRAPRVQHWLASHAKQ